jgi:hypothetical protein
MGGRYRVISLLGRGGMGEVYRVDDLHLGLAAALKLLPARLLTTLPAFRSEVRLSREVTHPNVCRVFDIGEADGRHFLTMEYVDGEDLASLLKRIGRLPPEKALDIAHQLCAGVAAAHARGVLHRDLKPANVMLDGRGQVRIMDFGLAMRADEGGDGVLAGTPASMAPEQFEGRGLSVRTDVYALGVMLYELFTGRRPFTGKSVADLARAHREEIPAAPSEIQGGLDRAIEAVILACLEKDPAARPDSVVAVEAAMPGDSLSLALAQGQTPSPQRVAAAGQVGGLSRGIAAALVAGTIAIVCAASWLARSTTLLGVETLAKPPEALADRGRELAQALGYAAPADTAWDWSVDDKGYAALIERVRARAPKDEAARPAFRFTYRESAEALRAVRFIPEKDSLTAWMFGIPGRVTQGDPPGGPGLRMEFSPAGRLLSFEAWPDAAGGQTPPGASPDFTPLFAAAGLAPARLRAAPPQEAAHVPSDARQAWEDGSVRVETASRDGVPVSFRILAAGASSPSPPASSTRTSARMIVVFGGIMVGAAILVRRHLRQGRSDLRGAWRVVGVTFLFFAGSFVAGTTHTAGMIHESYLLSFGLSRALYIAAIVGMLYLAVEPQVRRVWPRMLISWARLVSGRWSDPLVGSDLLVGVLTGCAVTAVPIVAAALGPRLGVSPRLFAPESASLQPLRVVLALHLVMLGWALGIGLTWAFLLVLARRALRSDVQAALLATAVLAITLVGSHPLYGALPGVVRSTATARAAWPRPRPGHRPGAWCRWPCSASSCSTGGAPAPWRSPRVITGSGVCQRRSARILFSGGSAQTVGPSDAHCNRVRPAQAYRAVVTGAAARGRSIVNTHPWPGRLRARSCPPFASMLSRAMASPSPSPLRSACRCSNDPKRSSGFPDSPPHSSVISIRMRPGTETASVLRTMSPSGRLNLKAFCSRFARAPATSSRSASRVKPGSTGETVSRWPRALASIAADCSTSPISSRRATRLRRSAPA